MKRSKSTPCGVAFLLAQLGAHAAERFADRIAVLGLSPPEAGILRMIATMPSCNQQTLGNRLGVLPSRMVILIDELAEKGLVERKRSQTDRRHSELLLTRAGRQMLTKVSKLGLEHENVLCAALTAEERKSLVMLC